MHARTVELETQLQVEARAKRAQMDANKQLSVEGENLANANRELQQRLEKAEQERIRMEAEARDSGEQLREMAEKVFQLLERLKLAELGKTKAVEALRKKEQELVAQKKKNSRLLKESTAEGKARVKAELDKKVLIDQIRALKKHNAELAARCREEVKAKLKEHEDKKNAQEKVRTLGGRLSFLLNKLQADEESKIITREEMKKMEAQLRTLTERNNELSQKLSATGESNRIITHAMRLKQEELQNMAIRHDALQRQLQDKDVDIAAQKRQEQEQETTVDKGEASVDEVRARGGRGRFFTEAKPTQGLLLIGSKKKTALELMERLDINTFLKRAQKSAHFKERVIEKVAQLMGLLAVEEEERVRLSEEGDSRADQVDHLARKTGYLQERLHLEEEAKRRTLLRYIHSVKAQATAQLETARLTQDFDINSDSLASNGGVIQLAESGIGDEEVHALAALLRGNGNITELNLRANVVTDEGARALGAVLAGSSALRTIDLRENSVGKGGVRGIAESLERADRVRHVYVHAGGKIEALGTGTWAAPRDGDDGSGGQAAPQVTVETVCVVDVRGNNPRSMDAAGLPIDDTNGGASSSNPALQHNASSTGGGRGGGHGGGSGSPQGRRRSQGESMDRRQEEDNNWAEPRTSNKRGGNKNKSKRKGGNKTKQRKESVIEKKRRERQRVKDQMETQRSKRTEGGWNGRAGGMQQKGAGRNKRVREVASNGTLPPLHQSQNGMGASAPQMGGFDGSNGGGMMDGSSTMPSDVSGHIQRANAAAEAILAPSGGNSNTGKRRTGKKSQGAFSKQLQNSPLMQPAGFGAAGKKKHT